MCTLALYYRVWKDFPLVIAANRDERYDRPAIAPRVTGAHPQIAAGRDLKAGGTWLGVNSSGVAAALVNRRADREEAPGAHRNRSRGLLCLDMLEQSGALAARSALLQDRPDRYLPFALVVADFEHAWLALNDHATIESSSLAPGVHVLGNSGDPLNGKIARARSRFSAIADHDRTVRDPAEFVELLQPVLGDHWSDTGDPRDAVCVHGESSGTVSSCVVVFAARTKVFHTYYCPGVPCRHAFEPPIPLQVER